MQRMRLILVLAAGATVLALAIERLSAAYVIPDAATALRVSLGKISSQTLTDVAIQRPECCRVYGTAGWGWEAQCLRTLREIPPAECTVVSWNIDRWGRPSSTIGGGGRTSAIFTGCYFAPA